MGTMISAIVASVLGLLSIFLYGSSYLYVSGGKKQKFINVIFLAISSVVAIVSLALLIYQKLANGANKNEIVLNFELVFIIILFILLMLYLMWFNFSKNTYDWKNSKWSFITTNIFNGITYTMAIVVIIGYIIGAALGSVWAGVGDIRWELSHDFKWVGYLFLAFSIIFWLLFAFSASWKIYLLFKEKNWKNIIAVVKTFVLLLGYALEAITMLIIFIAFNNINDINNWFASEFMAFLLSVYSNTFTYLILYMSIFSIVSISLWYVPTRFIKRDLQQIGY